MATISLLSRLVNGVQRQVNLSTNILWVQDLQLNNSSGYTLAGTTSGHAGSSLIGDDASYTNFTPASATVKGALSGIDTALGASANSANRTLSNLQTPTAINQNLLPATSGSESLGTISKYWGSSVIQALQDASGALSVDPFNRLLKDSSGTATAIDWQNRLLSDSAGATQLSWSTSGVEIVANPLNMNSNKIISLANGTNPNDAVNFSQLTSLSTGLIWQNPIRDPDLVDDSQNTPPVSPVYSLLYIIAASPTGAWAGLAGHAVWWDGAEWIDLSTGNTAVSGQGAAVAVGDRFLVAAATPQVFSFTIPSSSVSAGAIYSNNGYNFMVTSSIVTSTTLVATSTGFPNGSTGTLTLVSGTGPSTLAFSAYTAQVGGGLTGENHNIATVTNNTPGSFAYTFATPLNNWAVSDLTAGSQHYGDSFTYSTASNGWIDFAGPAKAIAGAALGYTGNTLNVLFDNLTIGVNGSNQLFIKNLGVGTAQLANASVTIAKLGTITDGVTLDQSGAGSSLEIKPAGVSATQLATTAFDQVTITGGAGTAASVAQSPVTAWTETAGQTFAANTTYAVRYGLTSNSETAGRVYAADITTTSFDLFWVIGFIQTGGSSVSAGTSVTVISSGSLTLKSGDTGFGGTDPGKPIFLQAGGVDASTTAPSTSGQAVAKIGIVQSTTQFRAQIGAPYVY